MTENASPLAIVQNVLEKAKGRIMDSIPPNTVSKDHFWSIAFGLVRSNADIYQCSPMSVAGAIYSIAKIGLIPDPILGYVYVVPFNGRATVIVGYRGFIHLGRRGGGIDTVHTKIRFANCEFDEVCGTTNEIVHRPWYVVGANEPGDPQLVYCVTTLASGRTQSEVMTKAAIDSVATRVGPWRQHWDEMARKSVVRRASKYWPLTTELSLAISLDEAAERGEVQPVSPQLDSDRFPDVGAAEDDQTLLDIIGESEPVETDGEPVTAPVGAEVVSEVAGQDQIEF